MKLATLPGSTADGTLVVVSADLRQAVPVPHIAPTMQAAMDHWDAAAPRLQAVALELDAGRSVDGAVPFEPSQALAPLPRAYAWLDGSSYLSHVTLFRKVVGSTLPESYRVTPLMYQGGSDHMLGSRAPLPCRPEWGADCEGEVAVIIGDVPMEPTHEQALAAIRLVTIVNDVSLRLLQPREKETGFGWVHCKPPTAFAPVVATPEALVGAWKDGKLHGPLRVTRNGHLLGAPDTGVGMVFDFARLIQHAAATRPLTAGTIIGSGTVSNDNAEEVGVACIAERRFIEQLRDGTPLTPYLADGDVVTLEMVDAQGRTIFGDIVQRAIQV